MPAATRDRALEAAVELLGTEGVRALTHARVDTRAGLPPGSTSNWFRTRRALLRGVVDWVADREADDLAPAPDPSDVAGADGLVEAMCAMADVRTGDVAVRTRARFALFVELAGDPELGGRLRQQHRGFQEWTERLVTATGFADPVPTTRALMALMDGLLLHRLALDPDLDVRRTVERAVRALAID
jgi:DNA-binding transcriptional regulator YbjK